MKTAIIQLAISDDLEKNRAKIKSNIEQCAKAGADLVVLSELHDTPYFCQTEDAENFTLAIEIPSVATDYYAAIARENGVVLLASFFEKRAAGLYHNTAVVFDTDGSIAGKYRKMHIPDDPAYYEKFYFTPGDFGFTPIKTSVGNLGVMICFDQWFPEAARLMTLAGADILIYPTAIGWEIGDTPAEQQRQREAWITVQRGHAVANGLPVIACNRVGWESGAEPFVGIDFWGSSFAAGAQGEILAQAADREEENLLVDIDFSRTEEVRQIWTFLRDRRIDAYEGILKRFID
jgi:N-carbamoylputrescine amidase